MNHTQLLNALIKKHGLKSYLEIGVRTTAQNFDKIECEYKTGVDPCGINNPKIWSGESDAFFGAMAISLTMRKKYDIIFVDGLHYSDQVKKDFENSLRCLNNGGFIVIHDTLPTKEETTCVPRGAQKEWFGDVYKFAMTLHTYEGIRFITYDMDCGCTVVWKDKDSAAAIVLPWPLTLLPAMNWQMYKGSGRTLLNVVPDNFPLP